MSEWLPPGYIRLSELVAEHGVDHMRTELYLGRFKVVRWNREYGTITEISSGFWISKDAVRWLTDGETSRIIDPYSGLYCRVSPPQGELLLVSTGELLLVKTQEGEPKIAGLYLSPFMLMMLEAIQKFEISETNPRKKQELVAHFMKQKLPNGELVSENLAEPLATAVRPVDGMLGRNRKKGPTH